MAFTVTYCSAICECAKIYTACAAVQERRLESNSVMAAVFVLAIEQDIGDVLVEPDTD